MGCSLRDGVAAGQAGAVVSLPTALSCSAPARWREHVRVSSFSQKQGHPEKSTGMGQLQNPPGKWDGWVGVGHGQSCLGKDFLSHGLLTAKTYKIREEIYDFLSFGHREKNSIPNWKMVWSKFRAASLWLWLGDTWEAEQVVFGFQQWVLKVAVLKWNETQGLFQDVLWFLAFQWSIMTC